MRPCALRYFNVAGADPELRTGQSTPNATHLVKVAAQAALGERPCLEIYGTDWDTPDGTCVRDYIHVSDLAELHVLALERLRRGDGGVFNCGYGVGYSVREVVDAAIRVAGPFEVRQAPRRAGDPASLIADVTRLRDAFDWEPAHDDIDHIVRTALEWERGLVHSQRSS
jgi:UDP-glucose 4-epimerase